MIATTKPAVYPKKALLKKSVCLPLDRSKRNASATKIPIAELSMSMFNKDKNAKNYEISCRTNLEYH